MKRFLFAALLLASFAGATLLGITPSAATTVTIDFAGKLQDNTDISGSVTFLGLGAPISTPGDPGSNSYLPSSVSFSITAHNATTTSTGIGNGSIVFEEGTAIGGYESFTAQAMDGVHSLTLLVQTTGISPNALPLLTLQDWPSSLTAWATEFGATGNNNSSFTPGPTRPVNFSLTSYTATISQTPVPASVLMFGTALAGLAGMAWFRRRSLVAA